MSRHRDVRNMDYTEDYDGYDDIYGHSVDDDYYISPSNRQFIYNRENSRDQPNMRTEQDIQEEDETAGEASDMDRAKLDSCVDQIRNTLGALSISKNELANMIVAHNYDTEKVTDAILNDRKDKDETKGPKFFIPKLNGLKNCQPEKSAIPTLTSSSEPKKFSKLSDLMSSHLGKSLKVTTSSVDGVTRNLSDLKVKDKSATLDYKIDLTVALRAIPSGQNVQNKSKTDLKSERFEIPFVDCDAVVERKPSLRCSFDVKGLLNVQLGNVRTVSSFGWILCRKYKIKNRKRIKHDVGVARLSRFNFATPSPDDVISRHLRI